jgi:hypothetical protein
MFGVGLGGVGMGSALSKGVRPSWAPVGSVWSIDAKNDRAWFGGGVRSLSEALATGLAEFTRYGAALAPNAAGLHQTFASDELRQTDRGLFLEPTSINYIQDSDAHNFTVGSPGAVPGSWVASGSPSNGISFQIVAKGTDDATGLPYVEVRFSGTATASFGFVFDPSNPGSAAEAVMGDSWVGSIYFALVAGTIPASIRYQISEYSAPDTLISGASSSVNLASGASSALTRRTVSRELNQATVSYVRQLLRFDLNSGVAYDFTVKLAAPQLEMRGTATTPILTRGGTATRNADALVLNVPDGDYDIRLTYAQAVTDLADEAVVDGWTVSTAAQPVELISGWRAGLAPFDVSGGYEVLSSGTTLLMNGVSYQVINASKPHSALLDALNKTVQFTLSQGDFYAAETTVNRSEVSGLARSVSGVDLWNAYTINIGHFINTADWMVLGQWHESSGLPRNPYVSFSMGGNVLNVLIKHYDPGNDAYDQSAFINLYSETPARGEDIPVLMRHRVGATGLLQIWLRGVLVVDYAGPLGYWNELTGPYWRWGIYRNAVSDTAVVRYINMREAQVAADAPKPDGF